MPPLVFEYIRSRVPEALPSRTQNAYPRSDPVTTAVGAKSD